MNITFDKCLRIIIGGRLKADRYRIWRAWSRSYLLEKLQQSSGPAQVVFDDENNGRIVYGITELPPDKDTTDAHLKHFKEKGVEPGLFRLMQQEIPKWRKEQQAKQRSEAAKARWNKAKRRFKKSPIDTVRKRRK